MPKTLSESAIAQTIVTASISRCLSYRPKRQDSIVAVWKRLKDRKMGRCVVR